MLLLQQDTHHNFYKIHQAISFQNYLLKIKIENVENILEIGPGKGFFAENYREHKIIGHRMDENYVALLQDLRQDSTRINELQVDNIEERKGIITLL